MTAQNSPGWLGASDPRIGLGRLRISTYGDGDDALARDTIAAAVDAGITIFDTARTYGAGQADLGTNERLVARALRTCDADRRARIVTKRGMTRAGGGWIPHGR